MSLDDFVDNWDESDSGSDSACQPVPQTNGKKEKKLIKKKKIEKGKKKKEEKVKSKEKDEDDNESESESDDDTTGAKTQKKYIKTLKQKDPEFFEFLKVNFLQLL